MLPSLIATDVDGTLLNHEDQITARTREAVQAAIAAGAVFVLATIARLARNPGTIHKGYVRSAGSVATTISEVAGGRNLREGGPDNHVYPP